MDKIKLFALGGLDEDGKNMTVVEINDEIYVIEVGLKYPQTEQLGVEVVIPDFTYLKQNKERVKGVFITQGHDDVMGALPYLIKAINPPIYTTPLIKLMLEDELRSQNIKKFDIHRIKQNSRFKIGDRRFVAFAVTHSIPDTFGIAIDTTEGYVVHSSEYIIDFDVRTQGFVSDVANISELGKKGVFILATESASAKRQGFTSPNHRIAARLERVFEDTDKRIVVSLYEQNIYRLIEVVEMAEKYNRKIFFYGEKQRRLMKHLEKLNYYRLPKDIEVSAKEFDNDAEDIVIIVSDLGPSIFTKMGRIAMGEDQKVLIRETDNVIVASPVVPGTESVAGSMINELYKDGVSVTTMNYKEVLAMHASVEDLKMMIALLKPKYYVPVKGEYQNLVANANVAIDMGIKSSNIVILDNGQIASFEDGRLRSTAELLKLEDMMIDGKDHLDTSGLVLRDRQTLATDGAIIAGIVLDFKTKKVLGGPDIQSRGVIYLKNADDIMKEVGSILENQIAKMVEAHKYENMTARNEARDLISKYIYKQTGKRPMVLPVIIEVHS